MNYIKELYIDENLKNSADVIEAIRRKENAFNVYVICVDEFSQNLAEIMPTYEAFAERNEARDLTLIGIAYGRRGAYDLFGRILTEYLSGGSDIGDFKSEIIK